MRMSAIMNKINITLPGLLLCLAMTGTTQAERLKDISSVAGIRDNPLIGYGLVVGLDGTGDKTAFTIQSLRSMLGKLGVTVPSNVDLKSKNVAAVSLHATLPPFSKPGQTIDVTVSSIGEAKSLRGGTLLMSPLKGADGNVYAIAQGNVIVGGFGVTGTDGSSITVNVPSVGRIPGGASVERIVPTTFTDSNFIEFRLNQGDFTTAHRVLQAINNKFGADTAYALDSTSIRVRAPIDVSQKVAYLSELENLEVSPADSAAKIIVNSRTGTIIIGKHVTVAPAAVTHGSLTVTITERAQVSQPNALSEGETVVVPQSQLEVQQENKRMFKFAPGISLDEIVKAINQVGAAPGDLVAILEALKEAGALRANLIVI